MSDIKSDPTNVGPSNDGRREAIQPVDQLLIEGLQSAPGEEVTPEWWAKVRDANLSRRSSPAKGTRSAKSV
jgi:hypothetical protein